MPSGFGATLLVVGVAACATPKPGSRMSDWGFGQLSSQVSFDHGCPAQKIRLIRYDGYRTVDLDVCGAVRRYKSFAGDDVATTPTLVDVTSLYPATSLPAPLPPDSGSHG